MRWLHPFHRQEWPLPLRRTGPGITGYVTAIKTAYWNHTPLLLETLQAANRTIGQGGFQEVEQMAVFRDMVGYRRRRATRAGCPRY